MAKLEEHMIEVINQPGRIGVLATTDNKGQPNLAYFGSAKLQPEGDLIITLADNRTLDNLEHNPKAVFLAIKESPVTFKTPGWRFYLKVSNILRDGEVFENERNRIAQRAGAFAETIKAAVIFDISEVRSIVG
jgi:hypothetical protein